MGRYSEAVGKGDLAAFSQLYIGGAMRHDWIFDVLADLRVYALENDLPALAAQVTVTLQVADLEIGDQAEALARRRSVAKEVQGRIGRRH
jgi:hypothetical protein